MKWKQRLKCAVKVRKPMATPNRELARTIILLRQEAINWRWEVVKIPPSLLAILFIRNDQIDRQRFAIDNYYSTNDPIRLLDDCLSCYDCCFSWHRPARYTFLHIKHFFALIVTGRLLYENIQRNSCNLLSILYYFSTSSI